MGCPHYYEWEDCPTCKVKTTSRLSFEATDSGPKNHFLKAPRLAVALLAGVDGAPDPGSDKYASIWRWMTRQLEAWESDVRRDERDLMVER